MVLCQDRIKNKHTHLPLLESCIFLMMILYPKWMPMKCLTLGMQIQRHVDHSNISQQTERKYNRENIW